MHIARAWRGTSLALTADGVDVRDPGFVFDDVVYSSYPQLNCHPYPAADPVANGVDVVSTANNHSLDRWALGADRTLEAAGLPYTGPRRADGIRA